MDEKDIDDAIDAAIDDMILEIGQLIAQKIAQRFLKSPMRTSQLSGQSYANEVLNDNPRRAYEVLRMPKEVFDSLCHWFTIHQLLQPSRKIEIKEQVMMFIAIVGHGFSNRQLQERYQHSGETVSRYFNQVLHASLHLYREFVRTPASITPAYVLGNPKYFANCIGAIDGCHINALYGKRRHFVFAIEKEPSHKTY